MLLPPPHLLSLVFLKNTEKGKVLDVHYNHIKRKEKAIKDMMAPVITCATDFLGIDFFNTSLLSGSFFGK